MKKDLLKTLKPIQEYFKAKGWKPFPFQLELWSAFLQGQSGLLHVPTGSGKTYAAVMGAFAKYLETPKKGLKVLYVTPLRALTRDIEAAIQEPIAQQGWPFKVVSRTGDTTYSKKKSQTKNPPDLMLITPESLAVLISQEDGEDLLKNVELVILDEWHELLSSKRGSLTELNLSYLRSLNPDLQIWALSASIGNLEQAAEVALGPGLKPVFISSFAERGLDIKCLVPEKVDRFPWAGHLGLSLRFQLIEELDPEVSTLIFTNTRMQAEKWFQTLLHEAPFMEGRLALHHSSLTRDERETVEAGVKSGDIKWVVCTSSLDLGVDFQPVERVVQIGSPKMIARMLQRAGRSAHRPGGKSKLLFVPTNAWEIMELEALKKALSKNLVEPRFPLKKPYDVLIQHMATLACGPGLKLEELKHSLKETYSFSSITANDLNWCLKFLTQGGETLQRYPQYHKLVYNELTGRYHIANSKYALLHRMSIGTIVSRESVMVTYTNRSKIGSVDESFISKLKKGDVFQFAGKRLEFVMLKDMTAYAKASKRPTNVIPSWGGNKFPISETLSQALREVLNDSDDMTNNSETRKALRPLLTAQKEDSILPGAETLLFEQWTSKEGEHLFVYPFEGGLVHEGLAQLWGLRFIGRDPSTFSFSVNDYGFEIMAPLDYRFKDLFDDDFFATDKIESEISQSLEISQMSQRQFREIAQIAGLIFVGYPGSPKTGRQMQVSSSMLYEVFKKHEPSNLLVQQSYNEVLFSSLENERMQKTLNRMQNLKQKWVRLSSPSPLAFPLLVERVASRLSNESLESKVEKLKKSFERTI